MYFGEFPGVKISALAAAVPDNHEQIMDYAGQFPEGEVEKFCKVIGVLERYYGMSTGITAADLCAAAAEEVFRRTGIDRDSIDGLIFLTQSPDYLVPPTSCVLQYRLGLKNCDVVYDSNIGCTGFPFGIQMACANLAAGCRRILLLVGESSYWPVLIKDDLLFGDCGVAAVLERTEENTAPVRCGIRTLGEGYKALLTPYGLARHPAMDFYNDRGGKDTATYVNRGWMNGMDVFSFSITDAPKAAKEFLSHFEVGMEDYDLISIHQANKMIVDNVVKRIKAPKEKIHWTLDRYGNTRGASTAMNICDYAERENVHSGTKRILNLTFGIGLNIALADFELDMGNVLPIIKTSEAFDDGIDNFTYFTDEKEGG